MAASSRHSRAGGNPEKLITTTGKDGTSVDHAGAIIDKLDIWSSAVKAKSSVGRGSSKKIDLYGIKKLREMIIDFALQGLLVEQFKNDEDSDLLYQRIDGYLCESIGEQSLPKLKRDKSVIEPSEFQCEIPPKWKWCELQDIALFQNGKAHEQYVSEEGEFVLINSKFVSNSGKIQKHVSDRLTPLSIGDIAMVMSDVPNGRALARCYLVESDNIYTLNQRIGGLITSPEMNKYFLLIVLNRHKYLLEYNDGKKQTNLKKIQVLSCPVPLPPLPEQKRIVAKVNELMALCDQLEQQQENSISAHQALVETLLAALTNASEKGDFNQAWARIAQHFDTLFTTERSIDQLKQTILQLAVMGKLVPQNPNDEPASVLLKKIAAEKEQLIKGKKIRRQKVQAIADEVQLYELPIGWSWAQLGELTVSEDNAMCDGPFGSKLKTEHYISDKGFAVVRLGNVGIGKFLWGKEGHISKEHYETLKNNHMQAGDLIVAGMADPLIRTCEIPSNLGPAVNKADCFRLRLHYYLEKKYISHYLNSHVAKLFASEENRGMTRQRINLGKCKAIPVPIPPIKEQHRIVSKVDEIITLCDKLKFQINTSQTTQLHLADAMTEQALNTTEVA